MGFDLVAKRPERGGSGYFGADTISMILLRSAMQAAGVKEKLIYKKFIANDGFLVTALEARTIGRLLNNWLKGRNLQIDLAEMNANARRVNDVTLKLIETLDEHEGRSAAAHLRHAESVPLTLERKARRFVRAFAAFCERSGGFWVE